MSRLRARVPAVALTGLLLSLPGCDAPDGDRGVTIEHVITTAAAPPCCEPGPFIFRASLMLRETAGVPVTLTDVTLTLTDQSGATTARQFSPADVFGAGGLAAWGARAGTVTFTAPLLTAGDMGLVIAFSDAGAHTGSAEIATELRLDLTGTWTGPLPIKTEQPADWSDALLSLVQDGDALAGEVVSREGVRFALAGSLSVEQTPLVRILGLPGTSTCAGVSIVLREFEFADAQVRRVSGHATGRCFGTVADTFHLRRSR